MKHLPPSASRYRLWRDLHAAAAVVLQGEGEVQFNITTGGPPSMRTVAECVDAVVEMLVDSEQALESNPACTAGGLVSLASEREGVVSPTMYAAAAACLTRTATQYGLVCYHMPHTTWPPAAPVQAVTDSDLVHAGVNTGAVNAVPGLVYEAVYAIAALHYVLSNSHPEQAMQAAALRSRQYEEAANKVSAAEAEQMNAWLNMPAAPQLRQAEPQRGVTYDAPLETAHASQLRDFVRVTSHFTGHFAVPLHPVGSCTDVQCRSITEAGQRAMLPDGYNMPVGDVEVTRAYPGRITGEEVAELLANPVVEGGAMRLGKFENVGCENVVWLCLPDTANMFLEAVSTAVSTPEEALAHLPVRDEDLAALLPSATHPKFDSVSLLHLASVGMPNPEAYAQTLAQWGQRDLAPVVGFDVYQVEVAPSVFIRWTADQPARVGVSGYGSPLAFNTHTTMPSTDTVVARLDHDDHDHVLTLPVKLDETHPFRSDSQYNPVSDTWSPEPDDAVEVHLLGLGKVLCTRVENDTGSVEVAGRRLAVQGKVQSAYLLGNALTGHTFWAVRVELPADHHSGACSRYGTEVVTIPILVPSPDEHTPIREGQMIAVNGVELYAMASPA